PIAPRRFVDAEPESGAGALAERTLRPLGPRRRSKGRYSAPLKHPANSVFEVASVAALSRLPHDSARARPTAAIKAARPHRSRQSGGHQRRADGRARGFYHQGYYELVRCFCLPSKPKTGNRVRTGDLAHTQQERVDWELHKLNIRSVSCQGQA